MPSSSMRKDDVIRLESLRSKRRRQRARLVARNARDFRKAGGKVDDPFA